MKKKKDDNNDDDKLNVKKALEIARGKNKMKKNVKSSKNEIKKEAIREQ